jgi:hypothetical protein
MANVDEPPDSGEPWRPPNVESRTGLSFTIDTNVVIGAPPAFIELSDLHDDGWINLYTTDTTLFELARKKDHVIRRTNIVRASRFLAHRSPFVEGNSLGPVALGRSARYDTSVDEVYAVIRPGVVDKATATQRHLRDAMHIATAVRYAEVGFITSEKSILNKRAAVRDRFKGFGIYSPEDALTLARRRVERVRALEAMPRRLDSA